jgi:hypothetical protein
MGVAEGDRWEGPGFWGEGPRLFGGICGVYRVDGCSCCLMEGKGAVLMIFLQLIFMYIYIYM